MKNKTPTNALKTTSTATKVEGFFKRLDAKREKIPTCLDRIVAAPVHRFDPLAAEVAAVKWSMKLNGRGAYLRPVQGAALEAISIHKTLLGLIGVGAGKTAICLMAGQAAGAKRPLVLAPPALVAQMKEDLAWWAERFDFIAPRLVSYGKLSVVSGANILEDFKPDLVIADEAHYLKRASSARTKRFLRFFFENPTVGFIGVSGSLTSSSLNDYSHLLSLTLRERAPIPLSRHELAQWAACIDAKGEPVKEDWSKMWGLVEWHNAQENGPSGFFADPAVFSHEAKKKAARAAFKERLLTTAGVVHTSNFSCDASLHIELHDLHPSERVTKALKELEDTWRRPDGEELIDASQKATVAKNLSVGFFYRWAWPFGRPDYEWLEARAEWNKEVRRVLTYQSRVGLDSPKLVEEYASSGKGSKALQRAWAAWRLQKHKPQPPKDAVWLTDRVVKWAVRWLRRQSQPSVLWYSSHAMGEALARQGVQVFGAGSKTPSGRLVAASIRVHGTGKNLQEYANAMVIEPPVGGGGGYEQLLGRHHRQGQTEDLVTFGVLCHTDPFKKAFENANIEAKYIEETTGVKQRLNAAVTLNAKGGRGLKE